MRAIEAARPQAPAVGAGGVSACPPPQKWAIGWLLLVVTFVLGCPPSAPPPAVGPLTCRAKPGKVDLLWTAAANATNYDVMRAQGGAAPSIVSTVQNPVYADFGLTDGVTYTYTVVARNSLGSAAPSPTCSATPNDRGVPPPNQPPSITSTPLLEAFEGALWHYQLETTDPDGDPVSLVLDDAPGGMQLSAGGLLTWTPDPVHVERDPTVRVVASDPPGLTDTQEFVVDVTQENLPPVITSNPVRTAEANALYQYPAEAYEPDGEVVAWSLVAPAPSGMSIGASSGVISWTPGIGDLGPQAVKVAAADPNGNQDEQTYQLEVWIDPLQLTQPTGTFQIPVGTEIVLPVVANYDDARISAEPLPDNATLSPDEFRFTPTLEQEGRHDLQFLARFAGMRAATFVTIEVITENAPPELGPVADQLLNEGESIRVPVTSSDPDGDTVLVTAPGLAIENAFFDQLNSTFSFSPSFEQAGSYNVTVEATDGQEVVQTSFAVDVVEVPPPPTNLELVVDPPISPTFATRAPIAGSVVGEIGPPPTPEPLLLLTGVAPTSVRQGRELEVILTGLNTAFAEGTTTVYFGDGIEVLELEVQSETSLRVRVSAAVDATLGLRQIVATQDGNAVPSVVAFLVSEGAAAFSGVLRDDFDDQPLVGATITVLGTNISTVTGPDGSFTLDGIPAGSARITISRANYEIQVLELSVSANQQIDVPDPIGVRALARPFNPGGSLPRAAKLASLLDRNVGGDGSDLTQEQAEALIQDTLLVVGGNEVGVLDENGNQLNPKLEGPGLFNLTSEGCRRQARVLVDGDMTPLGEVLQSLIDLYEWSPSAPVVDEFIVLLQAEVDEAWSDPANPENAMAVTLFNGDRTSLAPNPPVLTAATPLNRFQVYLLTMSYAGATLRFIESDLDLALIQLGIDPSTLEDGSFGDTASAAPGSGDSSEALKYASSLAVFALETVFGRAAHAQAGDPTLIEQNKFRARAPFGRTFTKVMRQSIKLGKIEAKLVGSLIGLGALIQFGATVVGGVAGGIAGATVAFGTTLALIDGALAILVTKLLVAALAAKLEQDMSPTAPEPGDTSIDDDGFLVIPFEISDSERRNRVDRQRLADGEPHTNFALRPDILHFNYVLWQFPDPDTNRDEKGTALDRYRVVVVDDTRRKFVISPDHLQNGVGFFRIATVQTIRGKDKPLETFKSSFAVTADGQTPLPRQVLDFVTKIPFSFQPDQVDAIKGRLNQDLDALLSQQPVLELGDVSGRINGLSVTNQLVKQEIVELETLANRQTQILGDQLSLYGPTTKALQVAESGEHLGGDFSRLGSRASEQIRDLFAGEIPSLEFRQVLDDLTTEIQTIAREADIATIAQDAQDHLDAFVKKALENAAQNPNAIATTKFNLVDPVTGAVSEVDVAVPNAQARSITPIAVEQGAKAEAATVKIGQSRGAIEEAKLLGFETNTPNFNQLRDVYDEREVIRRDLAAAKDLQKAVVERFERLVSGRNLDRAADAAGASSPRTRLEAGERGSPFEFFDVGRIVSQSLGIFGGSMTAADTFIGIVSEVRKLESNFSDVIVIRDQRQPRTFRPQILRDPNIERFGGIVTYEPVCTAVLPAECGLPDPRNPTGPPLEKKAGQFRSLYPTEDYVADLDSAGFPPFLITSDDLGRIYTVNGRSTDRFGGRIFRYNAPGAMERVFAGSIKYYNATLGYGQPAGPVAMAAGKTHDDGPNRTALFIAHVDEDNNRREIVRMAVWKLDVPDSGGIVGESYLVDSRLQLTGPSDMLALPPDAAGNQRIYLTDESHLWLIQENVISGGGATLTELVNEPGRRWSGLALDPTGNLWMADFISGDVVAYTPGDISILESGAQVCRRKLPLEYTSLALAEDIEIDHSGTFLSTSDSYGLRRAFNLPVVIQSGAGVRISASALGVTREAIRATDPNGICPTMHYIEPIDDERNSGSIELTVTASDGHPFSYKAALPTAGPLFVTLPEDL